MDERSARRSRETGCHDGPRGLSVSQPRMRADTRAGPEQSSTWEAWYIDAALTFVRSALHLATHGRTIHPGTFLPISRCSSFVRYWGWIKRVSANVRPANH